MLRLEGVGKRFGPRVILRKVSLRLAPGTVSLLVGANGAGKTTLLRLMAGLLAPDAGTVTCACPAAALAYLGHATFLYHDLTALENLAFWDKLYGGAADPGRLLAVLARVELEPFAQELAGAFSRGMAQRLNLARVLLRAPGLLLLDEPGTGLDARSQAILRREITAARGRGAAVAWITHDVRADAPLADAVLALAGKTLAFAGTPAEYADFARDSERDTARQAGEEAAAPPAGDTARSATRAAETAGDTARSATRAAETAGGAAC